MTKEVILILIILIMAIAGSLMKSVLIRKYTNELMISLLADPEQFKRLINKPLIKFLFDPFNLEYMKMNYMISYSTKEEVKQQIAKMDKMALNKNQKEAMYINALKYFISIEDEKAAYSVQKKFNAFVDERKLDPQKKVDVDTDLQIYFQHSLSTLPYIDEKIEKGSEKEKVVWNMKKAFLLKRNNRLNEAKECIVEVMKLTSDAEQKRIMQDLLDDDLKSL